MFLSVRVLFPFPFKSEVKSHHCLLNEHVESCVLKKFFQLQLLRGLNYFTLLYRLCASDKNSSSIVKPSSRNFVKFWIKLNLFSNLEYNFIIFTYLCLSLIRKLYLHKVQIRVLLTFLQFCLPFVLIFEDPIFERIILNLPFESQCCVIFETIIVASGES